MPVFETIDQLVEHRKVSQLVQDVVQLTAAADHIEQLLASSRDVR